MTVRLEINLLDRVAGLLHAESEISGLSMTDCTNQAIQMYSVFQTIYRNGGSVYVKYSPTADPEPITFVPRADE